MKLLKHERDFPNVIRAFLAPFIFFWPYIFGLPEGYELLTAIIVYFALGDSNYILHLHIHHPFTRSRPVNMALDLCLASVTGMTASNWRIQHLHGHHRGVELLFNGSKDWEIEKYSPLRALSYCLRSMWLTFCRPFMETVRKGVLDAVRQPINYRWGFIEHCLLFTLVLLLAWIDAGILLLYTLPLYVLTYFITRYVDYLNHYGCNEDSENKYEHANNSLSPMFNRLTHNFGYHTAHHLIPGAHWTALPDIHRRIEHRIPERCKKPVNWSWVLIPYHFYLSRLGRM